MSRNTKRKASGGKATTAHPGIITRQGHGKPEPGSGQAAGTSTFFISQTTNDITAPVLPPSRRTEWLLGLFLVVATVLAYQQTWHAGFIWDDDAHLTENPCIVGELGFKGIWTTSAATYYPLVLTSFWVLHALWGLNPLPFHVVNVLMHAACALLLWRVLRRLHVRGAWLGAALWSLHPIMVESVAWITELKNTQSCFFYLLAILFFIKWREARNLTDGRAAVRKYALVLLCAVLAILSKSSTVVLPVILGLCWWWLDGRWRWRNVAWLSPFLAVSLAASAWTIWEQQYHSGALGPEWNQSLPERVVIAGKVIWFYLGKLCWPHPLTFIYPRWQIDALNPMAYLPVLAAAGGLLVLWLKRNGQPRPLFFATAYFVAALLPVLGFFSAYFFRYSFVGDHLQYLASIGPIALAGAGIDKTFHSFRRRAAFLKPVFCGALLSVLGLLTWQQCAQYANAEMLYRTTISRNPSCWLAYSNLGALKLDNSIEEAVRHFKEALRLKPDLAEGHSNLGNALLRMGRFEEAITECKEAQRLDPKLPTAHVNLGNIYQKMGLLSEAVLQYQEALRLKPDLAYAHNNLGNALQELGRFQEALTYHNDALRLNPDSAEAHNGLGNALQGLGRLEEAVIQHNEALRINPGFAEAHNNLSNALQKMGRLEEAEAECKAALQLKPDLAEAYYDHGNILQKMGHFEAAVAQYQEALKRKPDSAEAYSNLGVAFEELKRPDEAAAQYRKALRLRPDSDNARFNLANLLGRMGHSEEALAEYEELLRHTPDSAEAHNDLGVILGRIGHLNEAVTHFQQALRLRPDYPDAHINLSKILAALKNGKNPDEM
jgi:tetratricopeptide (TPR) repeat protein